MNRDPIGERGELNVYGFVGNRPIGAVDRLGLEAYGYFEVWLSAVDYNADTLKGFRSKYELDDKVPCPCRKKERIVVIQAVDDPLYSPKIDASPSQSRANRQTKGGIPPPPYVEGAYYNQDPWLIVDAPLLQDSELNNGTWVFEDCAVCRYTFRGGTWYDQVLGCVKFTFRRVNNGQTELDVESGGRTLRGQTKYRIKAEDPGSLWNKAIKKWNDEAGSQVTGN